MKKKKILSMALISFSITLATTGILSIAGFTGKGGEAVAATDTATNTATGTATGTPNYQYNYIPLTNTTVERSLDFSAIQNRSQTVTISFRDVDPTWVFPQWLREIDPVSVVFPQAFVNQQKLQGKFWIDLAYDNASYNTYKSSKESAQLLIKNGYKVIDKLYDFKLIASSFNGDQSLISKFDKPITITASLSDSELTGFDKSKLKVLYVDANGNIEVMPTTINGNDVTFTTTHFSTFYIGQVQDSIAASTTSSTTKTTSGAKTSDSNNVIGIISLALGSIVVGTTVCLFGIKKRSQTTK